MLSKSLTHRRARRALALALAAAAATAPAAVARPADMHRSIAQAAADAQPKQHLRSPDARDVGTAPRHPRSPGHPSQAVNAPGATVDSATRPALPGPPTWPADPVPLNRASAPAVADNIDGADWTTIGLGITGSLLAVSGLALLSIRRNRRTQRLRGTV
jgi:hypothetical protein